MGNRALAFLPGGRRGAAFLVLAGAFAACGGVTIDHQSTAASSSEGAGGAPSTSAVTGGSGATGGAPDVTVAVASSSASGLPPCLSGPSEDKDGDGFTVSEGDCNDCDPLVNPDAIEVIVTGPLPGDGGIPVPVDDDCNGLIDEIVPLCDTGLALADADPLDAAHAIDLCKVSSGPKSGNGPVSG